MTESHPANASPAAATTRIVAATVHGRMLVQLPRSVRPNRWFVGFHGYAQNAEMMLEMLSRVPGAERWLLASVQALHPFYNRADVVVANWMTRQDREHAIADNIGYVDAVWADLAQEFGEPRALVCAGFSQGVAMAYRAATRGQRRADAVLAVAGDVPPELLSDEAVQWPQVRIVTGSGDDWYTPAVMRKDVSALEAAGARVSASVFEGGHEWTNEVNEAAAALLAEFGARPGSIP